MLSVVVRKPEDINLEAEYKDKIKQLQEEYQGKRSVFDKTLAKYNTLLKKLNTETNSIKIGSITEDLKKLEVELNSVSNNDVGKVIAVNTDKKVLPAKKKKNEN